MVTGDGSQARDFVHVSDLAKANYQAAIHKEKINTSFNIGKGSTISILDLAKMINDDIQFISKREGEADITFADISKARKILSWDPELTLADYIRLELDEE